MHRIAQFLDSDLGAGLLAFGIVALAGIGFICATWPETVIAAVGL